MVIYKVDGLVMDVTRGLELRKSLGAPHSYSTPKKYISNMYQGVISDVYTWGSKPGRRLFPNRFLEGGGGTYATGPENSATAIAN